MGKLTIGGFLGCMLACAACNGDSTSNPGGSTTSPFVGTWACSNERTVNFTMPAGVGTRSESTMSTLKITEASGVLSASEESDGAPACKVMLTSSGTAATLSEGQTCMRSEGLTLTYKSGSATVNGSALNSTFEFDATGTLNMGGMMVPAAASGSQTGTCSRLTPPSTSSGNGNGSPTGGW